MSKKLKDAKEILVTGGLGYVGSHTVAELLNAGHQVTIIDNLCNSSISVLNRINRLTGKSPRFYEGDIRDESLLSKIFSENSISSIMHFAGLKSANESELNPDEYYDVNVTGSECLINVMNKNRVRQFVFSSTAMVYDELESLPISETSRVKPGNPYGKSKRIVEEILQEFCQTDSQMRVACLRYFNPIGAHPSGEIGEDPVHNADNLMPNITRVAIGKLANLEVYGNDYETKDGTGVRDYIHVMDLASAHIKAIDYLSTNIGYKCWNLGIGRGYSVLDVVKTFEYVNKVTIPYKLLPRRKADIAESYTTPELANGELGWKAIYDIEDMVRDSWNWQVKNSNED